MLWDILGIVLLVIIPLAFYKYARGEPEEEQESRSVLYTYDLHQSIQRLAAIDNEIQAIDDLIQNITYGCDDDVLHSIAVSWKWHSEQAPRNIQFPCYMESKNALLQLAYSRRRELLAHLSAEFQNMPVRHRQNEDKTIANIIKDNPLNGVGEGFEHDERK